MKKINITSTLLILGYLVVFLLTFDLAIESYKETEFQAGNILFVTSAILIAIGIVLYYKYKPKIFK